MSIVGDEVFSFNLTLNPHATEGEAYTDMSKVDGTICLKVGCIQLVYLHKFLMSLLVSLISLCMFLQHSQISLLSCAFSTASVSEREGMGLIFRCIIKNFGK